MASESRCGAMPVLKVVAVGCGWLMAALGLYATLVGLELHWNLFDWRPVIDRRALGLLFLILVFLAAFWYLTRATRTRGLRWVSAVVCVALLALGIYVFPAEPKTQGLFARENSSPLWYRGGRLLVLIAPSLLWCFRFNNWRRGLRSGS